MGYFNDCVVVIPCRTEQTNQQTNESQTSTRRRQINKFIIGDLDPSTPHRLRVEISFICGSSKIFILEVFSVSFKGIMFARRIHLFLLAWGLIAPSAFGFHGGAVSGGPWTKRSGLEVLAAAPEGDLWSQVPVSLLKVGAKGAQPSHARSLGDLLHQHSMVKVKLSDHRMDVDAIAAVLKEAENAELLEVHESKRYLLFGQRKFKAIPTKEPKADTRGEKVCRTCGELGHIAFDCPNEPAAP